MGKQLIIELEEALEMVHMDKDFTLLYELLTEHPEIVNIKIDDTGKTPLHYAVEYNNYKLIQELLINDADINSVDEYDRTALHLAIDNGNDAIIKLLLKRGANANARDEKGYSPYDYIHNAISKLTDLHTIMKSSIPAMNRELEVV